MRQEPLSPREYAAALTVLPKLKTERQVALGLGLFCGLRPREILAMRWRDVWNEDEPRRSLTVYAEISKTGIPRTIPIPEQLREILKIHKKSTLQDLWDESRKDYPLLPGNAPQAYSAVWLRQFCLRFGRKYLKRKMSPYTLRHTFATRLLKVSNLRIVQEALGHVSITSTQIYTHVTRSDLEISMEMALRNTVVASTTHNAP
jgi:integrase/recombinase XerD